MLESRLIEKGGEMSVKAPKRTQHCTFCKNHGLNTPKKGHQCPHLNCGCLWCKLTKKAQIAMRHQQRVWRHQKNKLKTQKFDSDEMNSVENKSSKSQACDKCRNHNILRMKRNHQCPFQTCRCEYCALTFKRREIMKHQQRVRRSGITSLKELEAQPLTESPPKVEAQRYSPDEAQNLSLKDISKEAINERKEVPNGQDTSYALSKGLFKKYGYNEKRVLSSSMSTPSSPAHLKTEPIFPTKIRHLSLENGGCWPREESDEMDPGNKLPPLMYMPEWASRDSGKMSASPQNLSADQSPQRRIYSPAENRASSDEGCDVIRENVDTETIPQYSSPFNFFSKTNPHSPFKPFPIDRTQPLQSLSMLSESLDHPVSPFKYGPHHNDNDFGSRSWLPPSLMESFRELPHHSNPLLHMQQSHISPKQPLIRPFPLNIPQQRYPGTFPHYLWNQVFLPFNLGLRQGVSDANMERFHSMVENGGFSTKGLFPST